MYQSTTMNLPERFYLTQKIDSVAVTPWLILLFSDVYLKGLCQLESMRSEVMQITFSCQNSIVFTVTRDFLHVLCHVQGSEFREVKKRNGFR